MSKQVIIAEEHRIAAVVAEDQIEELIVATGTHQVGDIYLGVVENVLPSIDAAFVNIGDAERNGFIHVSDLGPLKLRKSAGSITELVAPQQKVLVQVMKEPTGTKGPRLTGNISLPGRYMVLMPYGRGVNLSRRIRNENERNRLRALAILIKPAGMGMVVRTEAEGVPEEAIIEDLEALQRAWESTTEEALSNRAPALLTRDDDFVQKVLRDVYSDEVNRIVVDSPMGLKRVKQHLSNWGGGRLPQGVFVDHHREHTPILEYFRVNAAIREALKPRVDLPSGGYIIIEKTEALTVIDVNSGSFTRSQTSRETVLWTNCEAATELARQLKLRNIAGVIVVDFIDMDSRRDQQQVLEHFNRALQSDKAKPQIAQLTELGLVELTRKRQGKNIYELFGQACGSCGGVGLVAKLPGEEGHQQIQPGYDRVPDASPSREPRRSSDSRSVASPSQDSDALELMHHPSYQERSGGRRGRGRRRRGELPLPKEPVTAARMSPWEEEARYTNRNAAAPEPSATVEIADERSAEREERPDRAERGERRGRGRRDRFPAEPPEFVHVEMTADEQEVYSWMGISPLVLSSQEVKNPRNTYIAVTLPGEPAPELPTAPESSSSEPRRKPTLVGAVATAEAAANDVEATQTEASESVDASAPPEVTNEETWEPELDNRRIRRRTRPINSKPTKSAPKRRIQSEEAAPTASEAATSVSESVNETGSEEPIVRRRRRRSSATK